MPLIKVNGLDREIAVALEWHLLPGVTSERKELEAIVKEAKAKVGCRMRDEKSGGAVAGISDERKPGSACGAAWLAAASGGDSIILIEPVASGRVWMCAVRAGLPVQGLDLVVDPGQVASRLPEFLDGTHQVRICSTIDGLDDYGYPVEPVSFFELTQGQAPVKLERMSGISPLVVGLLGALVVAGAGYYSLAAYMAHQEQLRVQAEQEEMQRRQAEQAEADRRLAILRRFELGEAIVKAKVLERPDIGDSLVAVYSQVDQLPTALAGWMLKGFQCDLATCSIDWARSPVGTTLDFILAAEEKGWKVLAAQGDSAVTQFNWSAQARSVSGAVDEQLVDERPFRVALESRLQQMKLAGIRHEIGAPVSVDSMLPQEASGAPAPGAAPAAEDPGLKLPWRLGSVSLSGTELYAVRDLPEYLSNRAVALQGFKVDVLNNQWTLEMIYANH